MKKLDDIPKKDVFKVPDGYFDQLPTVIQARMAREQGRWRISGLLSFSLRYALPVIALVIAGIFWLRPAPSIEGQLNDIDADQIALYLDNTYSAEITVGNEETLTEWTEAELNELEDEVYSNMEYGNEIDDILNDIDDL